jgi:5-methylcytosine-specific restriction endonuclease McrA/uncharacterized Zn finger protein (UPF0148 family)
MSRHRSRYSQNPQFDAAAYWATRKSCQRCGNRTKFSQGIRGEVLCARCQKSEENRERLRREPLEKAEQARTRAAELDARLRVAQEEAIERNKDSENGLARDRLNSTIRVEMLTAQAEVNQEYIRLGAEIAPIMASLERLQNANTEDFSPQYDSKAIASGLKGGIGGAVGGVFVGFLLMAIVAATAKALLGGKGLVDQFPVGSSTPMVLMWAIVAVAVVIGATVAFAAEANTKAKENARSQHTRVMAGQIEKRKRERAAGIVQLEQKVAELRSKMVRIILTANARKLIWERDKKTCYLCGGQIESWLGKHMHVDHLFPWSHGGSNAPENLRATHVRCNLAKSNRIIDEERKTAAQDALVTIAYASAETKAIRPSERANAREAWEMVSAEWQTACSRLLDLHTVTHDQVVKQEIDRLRGWNCQYGHNAHKLFVKEALQQGKTVPPQVLADYPDLTNGTTERSE